MNAIETVTERPLGLSDLARVKLDESREALLAAVLANCSGSTMWRHRKKAEARDLLALAQVSRRLRVHWLDLGTDLRALLELLVPVARLPDLSGPLEVAAAARLGVTYREEALRVPQPGYTFVQIVAPSSVWHPNVSADGNQLLCLGTSLPAGLPVKEILMATYAALTMMSVQLNPGDSAGVMNPAAAEWWQRNTHRIPLSKEPFVRKAPTRLW